MNPFVVSPLGVAGLAAHFLLGAASLVLAGLAIRSRSLPARAALSSSALVALVLPLALASGWVERVGLGGAALLLSPLLLGIVVIRETQVGVMVKKFARRNLPAGQLIALDGEAGYQADTLPPGVHFGYGFWQYAVQKAPVVIVPSGEIALVVAAGGAPIPAERILARVVDCDNFQDARRFLREGGEKGRQLGLLTAGSYRINPALFQVITRRNADGIHEAVALVNDPATLEKLLRRAA